MCLILFAHKTDPNYPLILAANRDEAYARPAAPAAFWQERPDIYGGRDLEKGGSWLGLTRQGRIAAVTNFRDGTATRDAQSSRGALVSGYLTGSMEAERYLSQVQQEAERYNGFVLIAGDLRSLFWFSNRGPGVQRISAGVHGLSNHLLDTPWPKIVRSRQALSKLLGASEGKLVCDLFDVLADRSEAADGELPNTGVGVERERQLSANFISDERYGTRASTIILIDARGGVLFIERSYGPRGVLIGESSRRFLLGPSCTVGLSEGITAPYWTA
jgi:uncharacterized protein with NRDE domain